MKKYACPECGEELTLTQTKDWCVDPDTGKLDCPTIDNFLCCGQCDHEVNSSDLESKIINLNLENNTL